MASGSDRGGGTISRPPSDRDIAGSGGGGGGGGGSYHESPVVEADLYSMPQASGPEAENSWSHLDASTFNVRGPGYLTDSVKISAGRTMFEVVHVDSFTCDFQVEHIAQRRDSFIKRATARGDDRFFVCVLYQTPTQPYVHLVLYFAAPKDVGEDDPAFARAWARFLADDTNLLRTKKWKVIPRIAEGSWLVKKAVGTKPAILPTKLTHMWHKGENYLEIDCDVSSSAMATYLVNLIVQYAKTLVIDLAFVIQGDRSDELPERVLCCVRLSKLDLVSPARLRGELATTRRLTADAPDVVLPAAVADDGADSPKEDTESDT